MNPVHSSPSLTRREALGTLGVGIGICAASHLTLGAADAANGDAAADKPPVLRLETDPKLARIPFLSWDTEGGDRAKVNLLRAPAEFHSLGADGVWRTAETTPTQVIPLTGGGVRYEMEVVSNTLQTSVVKLHWEVSPKSGGGMQMKVSAPLYHPAHTPDLRLVFPLDMKAACTTVIPARWGMDGGARFPLIISAPDYGQMLVTSLTHHRGMKALLEGNYHRATVDLVFEFTVLGLVSDAYTMDFTPLRMAAPKSLADPTHWPAIRRGWFNTFQPSAIEVERGSRDSTPGILANNVISNRVINVMYLWADAAFLAPEAAPGISFMTQIRRTLDWVLDERTNPAGDVVGWSRQPPMLDANAAPLIAAWDYVESTGDLAWLAGRIAQLEQIADHLAQRDVDGDGMVELKNTGNYGEMTGGHIAFDCYNTGHKCGYVNALTYRAWRGLADLERTLGRSDQATRHTQLADKLKSAYAKTLLNPATGWLAWWRSADGALHDYASTIITSMAIEYGLVPPEQGREMLARLWNKIDASGFTRFDLGLPCTLDPVKRGDYIKGAGRSPQQEDGRDTFQQYLNGGCLVMDTYHFLNANHICGDDAMKQRADTIMKAMIERQRRGVFPNGGGFQNGHGGGAEFFTWDGQTTGYEGHLTYSWSFLQTPFLREAENRARLFRPMISG